MPEPTPPSGDLEEIYRRRLASELARLAPVDGRHTTAWPGLTVFRAEGATLPSPTVYMPCLCVVGQGAKLARSGEQVYRYDASSYLVIGASLPLEARILEASPEEPFLSLVLDLDLSTVHELLVEIEAASAQVGSAVRGSTTHRQAHQAPIRISRLDTGFLGAVLRFLNALEDSADRRVLADGLYRELLYLTLRGDQGDLLCMAAQQGGRSPVIMRAIRFIESRFDQEIDVASIADEVGMSSSALHYAFKQATALTPIQYLKRYRLHRGLQLMLEERCQAAEAAWRVGYASASYFNREFKNLYGLPPRQYVKSGFFVRDRPAG